jgi:hypothetical protein
MTDAPNLAKVLTAIKDHWRTFAVPPTIRAVSMVTGINSTSLISHYYSELEERGEIKLIKSKPVTIQIYRQLTGESSP